MRRKVCSSIKFLCVVFLLCSISLYCYLPSSINIMKGDKHVFELLTPFNIKIDSNYINACNVTCKALGDDNKYVLEGKDKGKAVLRVALGFIPIKKVEVDILEDRSIIPVGKIAGIKMYSDGVIVLDTGGVLNAENVMVEPARKLVVPGDIITEINGKKINSKEDIAKVLEKCKGKDCDVTVIRDKKEVTISITPVLSLDDGLYKLGIWVRDSTQGIGTITYFNPRNKEVGMLGHAIVDVDTKGIINVRCGSITEARVINIKKGEKELPGEIMGILYSDEDSKIGDIYNNSDDGIFALAKDEKDFEYREYEVASQDEVILGEAFILSDVVSGTPELLKIEIEEINKYNYGINEGMVIKIVDERLLDKTGGIVQGMSGSPIIQGDKVIGAVTHVFVSDPTRGYGIFIENMLD